MGEFVLSHLEWLINALLICAGWSLSRTFARTEQINSLDRKILSLDSSRKEFASLTEVHRLELRLQQMEGKLGALEHQQFLLVEHELGRESKHEPK